MPWCPVCGTEYRPGFRVCNDCAEELVETPPPEERPPVYDHQGSWSLLVNVYSTREAEMLAAWLESEGIPVLKRSRGAGQYMEVYLGNAFDIDLYIPEDCLAAARALISANPPSNSCRGDSLAEQRVMVGKSLIIWLIVGPTLLAFMFWLFNSLK